MTETGENGKGPLGGPRVALLDRRARSPLRWKHQGRKPRAGAVPHAGTENAGENVL